jgi:hypothetical protein
MFARTVENINRTLGPKPFTLGAGLNAALFDAVFTAFARHERIPRDIKKRYSRLIKNEIFRALVTATTTEPSFVQRRLSMADSKLFHSRTK